MEVCPSIDSDDTIQLNPVESLGAPRKIAAHLPKKKAQEIQNWRWGSIGLPVVEPGVEPGIARPGFGLLRQISNQLLDQDS